MPDVRSEGCQEKANAMEKKKKAYCLVSGRHMSEEDGLNGMMWGTWEGRRTLEEQEKNGGVGHP